MAIVDLVPIFHALNRGNDAVARRGLFIATPIPGYERHRVAITEGRWPSLLVAARDETPLGFAAPIRLEKLAVEWDRECTISTAGGAEERGCFTVICCTDESHELQSYFLRVAGALVATLGPNPLRLEIVHALESMVELFRVISAPAKKSVQGLWGELFLISQGTRPAALASAWHDRPEERFDFHDGAEVLEVKSAAGYDRVHYFSLEQLRGPAYAMVVVASLFVVRVGAGLSLRELLDRLRLQLCEQPDLVLKVEAIVGSTLGVALREALDESFDEEVAATSLAFYAADAIPSVPKPIPAEVTDVHFKADLTFLEPLDLSQLGGQGLYGAALPK